MQLNSEHDNSQKMAAQSHNDIDGEADESQLNASAANYKKMNENINEGNKASIN